MSERWRKVDELSRDLALAVDLTDEVTGGQPAGEFAVRVEEADERPVRNPSGYYLFFDLPEAELTVAVDGGDRYHDASRKVDLEPAGGARDPGDAVELTLAPTPSYRFPAGLTRVRGTVLDGSTVVPGADVSVAGHQRTVTATDAGEFVYYFDVDRSDVTRDDVDNDNEKERVYRPGGADPEFVVDGAPGQMRRSVVVEVGRLTTRDLNYQP